MAQVSSPVANAVALARELERALARVRKARKVLAEREAEVLAARRSLSLWVQAAEPVTEEPARGIE